MLQQVRAQAAARVVFHYKDQNLMELLVRAPSASRKKVPPTQCERGGAGGRQGSSSNRCDDPGSNPVSSDIVLTDERRDWSEKQEKHRRWSLRVVYCLKSVVGEGSKGPKKSRTVFD